MSNIWESLIELPGKTEQKNEFLKKFKNTVLGLQTKQSKFFAYFQTIDENKFIFHDLYNQKIILSYETEVKVFVPVIIKGYYEDSKKQIYYITKNPVRQWLRSIHPDNTKITPIISLYDSNNNNSLQFPHNILDILTYEEKNKNTQTKIISKNLLNSLYLYPHFIRLNKDFVICLNLYEEYGYNLFFHNHLVGTILKTKNTIILNITTTTFQQEILDSLNTWGQNLILD